MRVNKSMDQKEFNNTIKKFNEIEDARDQLWDRARNLIKKGFEVEAYILILATWNFASFRYIMKTFNLREFKDVISRINPIFKKLENKKFENISFDDGDIVKNIKFIYAELKKIAKQTGATKIMALKNHSLFIMWDTEIRKMYNIKNNADPDDYLEFLKKMKDKFGHLKSPNKETPLAKAIDEYNYVVADKRRAAKNKK